MVKDLIIDGLLTLGFGVQHSIIATLGIKKLILKYLKLDSMQWRSLQSFINVNYILLAFSLWRPSDYVVYELTGVWAIVMGVCLVIGWLWYFESHIFEYDCGQAFGCSAIIARVFKLEKPIPELWKVGGRRWIRFPVHTAFFPMFLCFPVMTADLLVFGIVINIGNIIGTILYDKRLIKMAGKVYLNYIDRTNLISPFMFGKKKKGAIDMDLPKPVMFKNPGIYFDAIAIGILAGIGHYYVVGSHVENSLASLYSMALFSLAVALVCGVLIGIINRNSLGNYLKRDNSKNMLTLIGAKCAIVSAFNIISFYSISYFVQGAVPSFAIILPLWLIVLWTSNFISAAIIIRYQRRTAEVSKDVQLIGS